MQVTVSIPDIADAMVDDAADCLDLLAALAEVDRDTGHELVADIATLHNTSAHHMGVAPFLRRLAAALEQIEAEDCEMEIDL